MALLAAFFYVEVEGKPVILIILLMLTSTGGQKRVSVALSWMCMELLESVL